MLTAVAEEVAANAVSVVLLWFDWAASFSRNSATSLESAAFSVRNLCTYQRIAPPTPLRANDGDLVGINPKIAPLIGTMLNASWMQRISSVRSATSCWRVELLSTPVHIYTAHVCSHTV